MQKHENPTLSWLSLDSWVRQHHQYTKPRFSLCRLHVNSKVVILIFDLCINGNSVLNTNQHWWSTIQQKSPHLHLHLSHPLHISTEPPINSPNKNQHDTWKYIINISTPQKQNGDSSWSSSGVLLPESPNQGAKTSLRSTLGMERPATSSTPRMVEYSWWLSFFATQLKNIRKS